MAQDKLPEMGDEVSVGLKPVKSTEKSYTVTFGFFARPPYVAYLVKQSNLTGIVEAFVYDEYAVKLTIEKKEN